MKLNNVEAQLFTENGELISEYGFAKEGNVASSFVPSIANLAFYIRARMLLDEEAGSPPWDNFHVSVYADKGDGKDNPKLRDGVLLLSRSMMPASILKGRKAIDQHGQLVEQKWMFVEKDLSEAFNSLTFGGHNSGRAGQIALVFHPVNILGRNSDGYKYPQLDQLKGNESDPHLSHSIGYGDARVLTSKQSCVFVKSARADNAPYATMTFHYRPVEELQKMGIIKPENLDLNNSVDQIVAQLCEKLVFECPDNTFEKPGLGSGEGSVTKNGAHNLPTL